MQEIHFGSKKTECIDKSSKTIDILSVFFGKKRVLSQTDLKELFLSKSRVNNGRSKVFQFINFGETKDQRRYNNAEREHDDEE